MGMARIGLIVILRLRSYAHTPGAARYRSKIWTASSAVSQSAPIRRRSLRTSSSLVNSNAGRAIDFFYLLSPWGDPFQLREEQFVCNDAHHRAHETDGPERSSSAEPTLMAATYLETRPRAYYGPGGACRLRGHPIETKTAPFADT